MALTEGLRAGSDIIKYEAPCRYSRKKVTISDGEVVAIGSILEKDGDEWIVCTTAANAAGIALEAASPDGDSADIVAIVRHAIVISDNLDYNSVDEDDINAALEDLGIVIEDALA